MEDQTIVEYICTEQGWSDPVELKTNWYITADNDFEPIVIELQKEDHKANYFKWSGTINL